MRPQEMAFITDQHKIQQLYVCWCAKEAVYKCYGQKEVSFADNILLEPFIFNKEGVVNAHLNKDIVSLDYRVDYLQYEDYMIGYVKG
jgi:phosphopantetheinyl transferase